MFKIKISTAKIMFVLSILISLATVGVVAVTTASPSEGRPEPKASATPYESQTLDFPRCSEPSGRYDNNCFSGDVVSFNYGKIHYNLRTGALTIQHGRK